eukprot:3080421-Amphidinium_carterae.1
MRTLRYFGLHASFFDFQPKAGSFEANPPFVPEVMRCLRAWAMPNTIRRWCSDYPKHVFVGGLPLRLEVVEQSAM